MKRTSRVHKCGKCGISCIVAFWTARPSVWLCGFCAGRHLDDPPQTMAFHLDPETHRVSRKAANGVWHPIDIPGA